MIDAVGSPQSLLVLGGTSEIGLAVAERYARQRPIKVTLAARPSPRLDAAAAKLRDAGATVTTLPFDARHPDTHAEVIEKAFADGDIDVTVLAFGVLGDQEEAWTNLDVARELAEVNYLAAVTIGVPLAERLRRQGHGAIVALSSVAGERARRSNFVYGSTKAGFDAFYTGMTYALKPHGVLVSVIRPGFVHSKMTEGLKAAPLSQTPEQVAEVVVNTVRNRREQAWAPTAMRGMMSVLRHVPRAVFRRLPF
ncbi:MAG: decaprenylphospho-beta-D-erythro-pentofuranosid-2-ulose 2-reductase [Kibdelosporangium sp.]